MNNVVHLKKRRNPLVEDRLLGCLMLRGNLWKLFGDSLDVGNFSGSKRQLIFKSIRALAFINEPRDVITVSKMMQVFDAESDDLVYVAMLTETAPTPSIKNVKEYVETVSKQV